nr:MFS transporter [Streptomyces sp. SPB78]
MAGSSHTTTTSGLPSGPRSAARSGNDHDAHPQRALRLAVACCVLLLSGAFLTAGGLLTGPLHDRDGLSRSAIGGVLALTTVLYGATAPLATGLARRTGLRPVAVVGLALAAGGTLGCVPEPLGPVRFALCWGGGVGLGCGAVSTAFAADFAQRRFRTRRGLVTGVLTSAAVLGQFGLLPLLAPLASEGACGPLLYALAALGLAGALLALLGLGPDTRPVGGRQRYGGSRAARRSGCSPLSSPCAARPPTASCGTTSRPPRTTTASPSRRRPRCSRSPDCAMSRARSAPGG